MARSQVPTVDPRDPDGMRKALRAIELILQEHGDAVDLLLAQRATVPVEETERPPDNAPVPTSITTTTNQDGSLTVELRWKYAQGARPSTQTVVVIKKGPAPLKIPVYWEDDVYTVPSGALYARIDLPSEHNYRFGVAVARGTPNGLEIGPVQAPTANPDWADIGGVSPVLDVPGLVNGKVLRVAAPITLTEATWVSLGSVVIPIPAWATDTKVLFTGVMKMGLTVTTGGGLQYLWRLGRNGVNVFTSHATRFDTASSITSSQWTPPLGPFTDTTSLTGNVTYNVEVFKDDLAPGNTVATAAADTQISFTYWSYK